MTASRWCQRWDQQQPSWAYADPAERFNPRGYTVAPVDDATAADFCTTHHYLRSYPAAAHRFGLFHQNGLIGVAVYAVPPTARVLTNPLPDLEPYVQSTVLARLVLAPTPGNAESRRCCGACNNSTMRCRSGAHGVASRSPRSVAVD